MMRALMLGFFALTLAGPTAAEDIWRSPKSGAWQVTASNGSSGPYCYMANISQRSYVALAVYANARQRLVFYNAEWNIPPGSQARIRFQIDGRPAWTANAQRGDDAQTIVIDSQFDDAAVRFLKEIRDGYRLYISFPNGQGYEVSLTGTAVAINYLVECNERYVLN